MCRLIGVGPQGWAIMVIARPERMVAARRAIAVRHVVRHPRVFQPIKHSEITSVPQLGFAVALQQFPIAFGCELFVNPGWYSPRQCAALLCALDFIPCVSKDSHLQISRPAAQQFIPGDGLRPRLNSGDRCGTWRWLRVGASFHCLANGCGSADDGAAGGPQVVTRYRRVKVLHKTAHRCHTS